MKNKDAVYHYRRAAMKQFGISAEEAEQAIVAPADDKGEWAPESLAVIYLEYGYTPQLDYYNGYCLDACIELSEEAGVGYIEYINAAVAAVYPA